MAHAPDPGDDLAQTPPGHDLTLSADGVAATPSRTPGAGAGAELGPGHRIGRYQLVERRGEGGMGVVFRARDPDLDRDVAIKLLRAGDWLDSGPEQEAHERRLLREAQAMARLRHPNLVTVYDVGTIDRRVFIAMEYIHGQTLRAWLDAGHGWRDVIKLFVEAGRGLSAAHQAGVVHRDFKPDNVLVDQTGRVQVVDFGLAAPIDEPVAPPGPGGAAVESDASAGAGAAADQRAAAGSFTERLTRTGAVLGTPAYMAPEQHMGRPAEARSDQFSFAVALYQALYGRRPFPGDNHAQIMASVLAGVPEPPPARTDVPAAVAAALMRALALDPARRFPSMDPFLAALERAVQPSNRRRRIMALAATGVVAVGAAGLGARAYLQRPEKAQPPIGPAELLGDSSDESDDGDPDDEARIVSMALRFLSQRSANGYLSELEKLGEMPDAPSPPDGDEQDDGAHGGFAVHSTAARLYPALPALMAAHRRQLERCAHADGSTPRGGHAVLRVTIKSTGRVAGAVIQSADVSRGVADCLTARVKTWRFPATGSRTPVDILVPFHLLDAAPVPAPVPPAPP